MNQGSLHTVSCTGVDIFSGTSGFTEIIPAVVNSNSRIDLDLLHTQYKYTGCVHSYDITRSVSVITKSVSVIVTSSYVKRCWYCQPWQCQHADKNVMSNISFLSLFCQWSVLAGMLCNAVAPHSESTVSQSVCFSTGIS